MSQIKTLNGVQYTLPQYNDIGWGANTGNVLTQYLAAIADVTLQPTGGNFTLTDDVNFGANFGLISAYFTSRTADAASAGAIRLAATDVINWRNNANDGNISLSKNSSDQLLWNATKVLLSGAVINADINAAAAIAYSKLALTDSIVNADINSAAAIAYSKLNLAGSIVNADINASAAIAYSKLNLAGAILNADINASAAIAYSKLATLTASRALQSSSGGAIEVASVTATELGYLSGVSSAIQTQLGTKAATDLSNVASVSANVPMNSKKFTGLAAGSAAGDSLRFEQLKIVQVVASVSSTQTLSTSSTYQAATNYSVTITPTSTSNKVLLLIAGTVINTVANAITVVTVKRGSTDLATTSDGFLQLREQGAGNSYHCGTFVAWDATPDASSTVYQVFFKNLDNTSNCGILGNNANNVIIAVEVAA